MRFTLFLVMIAAFFVTSSKAAMFTKSKSDVCVLRLDGDIVAGDFQRFTSVATQYFEGSESQESSANDTICLNSPGGSVAEGIKLATAFQEMGVGTRIAENDGCYSICAIMFMMGQAQGAEVKFVNRKMHMKAQLGFHRPYMLLDSPKLVSARVLPVAYDIALESLTDIMLLATSRSPWSNIPMIKPDLVQLMLKHIGDDLFLIDTVEKAGRFDIDVFGYQTPQQVTDDQLFYACENSFHWQVGLIGGDTDYEKTKARDDETVKLESENDGVSIFNVTSDDMGYSEASCKIRVENNTIAACGYNEMYDVVVGGGACDTQDVNEKAYAINDLARFKPSRKLATLPSNRQDTAPVERKGNEGTCFVFSGKKKLDEETCEVEIDKTPLSTKYSFLWPSGNKTMLQLTRTGFLLNGEDARIIENDGYEICAVNLKTMNLFCFKK